MPSSASHLFLLAIAFLLAVAAPGVDAWGGRLFFSKMTRPGTVVEADKAADTTTLETTESFDANSAAAAFARPSSGGSNRGYGLYGRPEENEKYPPAYFRRGVHHDAEKRTTTNVAREEPAVVPVEEQQQEEESSRGEKEQPAFPENGSGRGRPLSYMRRGGKHEHDYGMSDTRLYQNGRYYYDVETDKYGYGYGYESNPVRRAPEPEDNGSGYGRAGGERRSERYGDNAAGYENRKGNGGAEKQNNDDDFQENQNEQYNP